MKVTKVCTSCGKPSSPSRGACYRLGGTGLYWHIVCWRQHRARSSMVEQGSFKPSVAGSTPAAPTKIVRLRPRMP